MRRRDRIDRALEIILQSGGVDGAHHKKWVLDQVVRALTGTPDDYVEWVRVHNDGADGPNTYAWDATMIIRPKYRIDDPGVFATDSGRLLRVTDPDPSQIVIDDIASAASKICRFGGHCSQFYSLAQHSVHVSVLCPPKFALWGLLHDAAEAYLGDVIRPIKTQIGPLYKPLERRWLTAIAVALDVPELAGPEPAEVKLADRRALATEYRDNMPWIDGKPMNPDGVEADPLPLVCFKTDPFNRGAGLFLDRWEVLRG